MVVTAPVGGDICYGREKEEGEGRKLGMEGLEYSRVSHEADPPGYGGRRVKPKGGCLHLPCFDMRIVEQTYCLIKQP
ncbi:MAG: hypothetical protein CMJ72_07280 [Planctomycetaceae bacterium]|nr:hypothetical protein [Planctomycetaceae bacterium]